MLCTGFGYQVENYKDYKNRAVTKHLDKMKNQLRQIKDCSLKGDDKTALKKKLLELIQEQL